MFYDAFEKLCEMRGKSAREVMRESGLGKTAYTKWKNGAKPLLETKIKLADYFGISVEELESYADGENKNEEISDVMSRDIEIFSHKDFGQIRTVQLDGEPWFVGKDVAIALGYGNGKSPINAVANHVDEEDKGVTKIVTPGGTQQTTIINESGVYALVFGSKLDKARAFKRWVTHEVIPSIRKHGAYLTPQKIEDAILNPDVIINLALQLKAEKEKNAELTAKAAYYDAVAGATGSTSFRDTAKLLGLSEKKFIDTVLGKKYCYRAVDKKIVPYSQYMVAGWFEVREVYYGSPDAPKCTIQTKITPYGRENIYIRFKREGIV
nr:MAG TPA: repressor domain protein [Caudoviricetes sp.]